MTKKDYEAIPAEESFRSGLRGGVEICSALHGRAPTETRSLLLQATAVPSPTCEAAVRCSDALPEGCSETAPATQAYAFTSSHASQACNALSF